MKIVSTESAFCISIDSKLALRYLLKSKEDKPNFYVLCAEEFQAYPNKYELFVVNDNRVCKARVTNVSNFRGPPGTVIDYKLKRVSGSMNFSSLSFWDSTGPHQDTYGSKVRHLEMLLAEVDFVLE